MCLAARRTRGPEAPLEHGYEMPLITLAAYDSLHGARGGEGAGNGREEEG